MTGRQAQIDPCPPSRDGNGNVGAGHDFIGGGDYPDRFYQNRPTRPTTKNKADITYDGNSHSSLQAAYDQLSPGESLWIDPENSPYQEFLLIDTDHTTVASDGAWIEPPNHSNHATIAFGGLSGRANRPFRDDASLDGPHNTNEDYEENDIRRISVTNTSPFSAGDDINIIEDANNYGPELRGNANGFATTGEVRTVTAVDSGAGELELNYPILNPYPATSSTHVGVCEWALVDAHLTGVNVRGDWEDGGDIRPLYTTATKNMWVDNVLFENGDTRMWSGSSNYQCRIDNITARGPNEDKAINWMHGSCTNLFTNIEAYEVKDYCIRYATAYDNDNWYDGVCSSDAIIDNLYHTRDIDGGHHNIAVNHHWGGVHVKHYNITATFDNNPLRFRSAYMYVDGFQEGTEDERGPLHGGAHTLRHGQQPMHIYVKNGEVKNKGDGRVFDFTSLEGDSSKHGTHAEDLNYENIHIEPYDNRDITGIGAFHSNTVIDGLHFVNITYGSTQLTRSHVEQWSNFNDADITDLTVE